jgi:hypothetical protein
VTADALTALAARCADAYGVPFDALISDTTQRHPTRAVQARQAVCYLAYRYFGASQSELATFFGRDRSTISHAITVAERRIRADRETRVAVLRAAGVDRNLDALADETRQELDVARRVVKRLEAALAHIEHRLNAMHRYSA